MRGWLVLTVSLASCSALVDTDGLSGGVPLDAGPESSVEGGDATDGAPASGNDAAIGDAGDPDAASSGEDAEAGVTSDADVLDTGAVDARTTCLPGATPIPHGPVRGTAATSRNGTGDVSWSQPSNALTLDGSSASASFGTGDASQELLVTGFGVSLPPNAVAVTGVEVTVTRRCNDGQVRDNALRLYKGGFPIGSAKSKSALWPTSNGSSAYGGASDSWSASLAVSDVEASDFGIAIRAESTGIDTGRIDDVYITVFYCD